MAQNHLSDFLADLKAINSGFRASTSSLKGLIKYLEETVASPVAMTYDNAIGYCGKADDPRIAKYAAAIRRLVSVWGKGATQPYPIFRTGDAKLAQIDLNRLCFRGDDRAPQDIFQSGFDKRTPTLKATYRGFKMKAVSEDYVRHPIQGFWKAGDLDPDSAVCVTPDLYVAALFPLPTNLERVNSPSWVYVVYVERGYNTYGRQVLDALEGLAALTEFEQNEGPLPKSKLEINQARINDIQQNLYGRELATDSIPKNSIWGAFKVQRAWATPKYAVEFHGNVKVRVVNGADYKDGGTFTVLDWVENPSAVFPIDAYRNALNEFVGGMRGDIDTKKTMRLPTTKDGFVPSLKK